MCVCVCVYVCVIPSPIDSTFRNISKHSPSRTYMCVCVCVYVCVYQLEMVFRNIYPTVTH